MLNNRSLTVQFAFVFLVALALVGAAFYLILDRIYVNQLKSQAETVADNVDAFGSWVAQYGRVWVKNDNKSYLGPREPAEPEEGTPEGTVPPPGAKLTPVDFYSKNPALAQREFSEAVERSPSPSKFRLTSHNVMNPEQQARRVRGRRAARDPRPATSRNTTSSPTTASAMRAPSTRRHRASRVTATPTTRPTTSRSATARPTASASRKATSPESSASACRRESFWDVALNVVGVWELLMIVGRVRHRDGCSCTTRSSRPCAGSPRRRSRSRSARPRTWASRSVNPNSGNELHRLALATERLRVSINMAIQRLTGRKPPA